MKQGDTVRTREPIMGLNTSGDWEAIPAGEDVVIALADATGSFTIWSETWMIEAPSVVAEQLKEILD